MSESTFSEMKTIPDHFEVFQTFSEIFKKDLLPFHAVIQMRKIERESGIEFLRCEKH